MDAVHHLQYDIRRRKTGEAREHAVEAVPHIIEDVEALLFANDHGQRIARANDSLVGEAKEAGFVRVGGHSAEETVCKVLLAVFANEFFMMGDFVFGGVQHAAGVDAAADETIRAGVRSEAEQKEQKDANSAAGFP